ncbi:MAG: protoporphyrinogen oxidase [Planctomycetaceae bacterium]|nr:protoporphyrinogen oxidase [Planctomycetaceae bacterium]
MVNHSKKQQHVMIVGGGLAGLSAAEWLLRQTPAPRITIVESAHRLGGVIETVAREGWLIERAADSFLSVRPEGIELVERLGLSKELVSINPEARRALVWSPRKNNRGDLVPVPPGFRLLAPGRIVPFLRSNVLSVFGRLRVAGERFIPKRKQHADESLESFAVRRLGQEAFDKLVQPLVSGIWTADPDRLSMAAACPEFFKMEQDWGSLTRGEKKRIVQVDESSDTSGARYGQFVSFRYGMQTLIDSLECHLRGAGVQIIQDKVSSLQHDGTEWQVSLSKQITGTSGVVLAVPASVAAPILAKEYSKLSAELGKIEFAGAAVVSLGFHRQDITHPLSAAGMIVPRIAGKRILAASFSSSKFSGRAPANSVLIRSFIGGALDTGIAELTDEEVLEEVLLDLKTTLGRCDRPTMVQVDRWHTSMPQYNLGHVERIKKIRQFEATLPSLGLAGGAYEGVGIPQVIHSGQVAAAHAIKQISNTQ